MSPQNSWPKVCACGRSYTRDEWHELKPALTWDLGLDYRLDMRHCECESTMAVKVYENGEEITSED
jgi:hypothetical protein